MKSMTYSQIGTLGLSSELEMNILIDLLQPHSGISNGIELATENDDMIAGKNTIFRKVRRE
jgi:hypothetical protein